MPGRKEERARGVQGMMEGEEHGRNGRKKRRKSDGRGGQGKKEEEKGSNDE